MNEDKNINLAEKIEKLIVDGQKEVLDRLVKLEEGVGELRAGQEELRGEIIGAKTELRAEIKAAHDSLKKMEFEVTASVLSYGIKEIGEKLDAHLRQPAHA